MFPLASDEMWQGCVLPIVWISDAFTQQETMNLTKQWFILFLTFDPSTIFFTPKWNILRSVSYLAKLCKLWNPSERVGGTFYMAQLSLVLDGSSGATLGLATICFKLYLFEIYCPTFPSVLPIVSQWVQNSWSLNVSPACLEFRSWETILSISLLDHFLRNLTQWMLLWRHH